MKRGTNPIARFFIGLVMLAAGGYWFMSSVTVTTGLYGLRLGGVSVSGGLVVVPFIVGIVWLFVNVDSLGAKLITVLGLVIIFASVIMSTRFVFHRQSLYEYLIMLIMIFGGAALSLQVLLAKPKDAAVKDKDLEEAKKNYHDLEKELEDLKKNM